MQEKHTIMIVRLLGLLILTTVLYVVRPVWQPNVSVWINLRSSVYFWHQLPDLFAMQGAFWATWCILFELVLIAKLVVAYGLFRIRGWARNISVGVLSADFLMRLFGIIN